MQAETTKRRRKKYTGEGVRMEQEELMTHRREEERVDLETLEFIQAVDRFKRKTLKVFPTWTEILEILRTLGYRKVMERPCSEGGSSGTL